MSRMNHRNPPREYEPHEIPYKAPRPVTTRNIKIYQLGERVNFGKYKHKNKTFLEVLKLDPDYIDWLIKAKIIFLKGV